ncbi:tetratricopeptide repeat protein [uncultured Arenimonas sp.]|uniref:tetratricopeptide repeat protein n=1 Tax=uncultured Arenimonas sp. TaxID=546226 RepID=UPI0030D75ACF
MSQSQDPGATPSPDANGTTGAFRFGRFELHPARHELLRDGEPVDLQPKVLEFIAYLLLNRGRVVDKNELLDAVWPRQVVTEAALSRCAMKARRALDDEAGSPQVILTVHGRGFRFIAPVEPVQERRLVPRVADVPAPGPEPQPPAAAVAPAPAAPAAAKTAPRPMPRGAWALGALAALTLALLGGWWWQHQADQATLMDGHARVAVLPIENATDDARYDWARLGLMQALTDILQRRTATVPADAVFEIEQALADLPADERVQRLRAAHGASHVVSGRLLRRGGLLRLDYAITGPDGQVRRRSTVADDVPALARAAAAELGAGVNVRGTSRPVSEDNFANEAYLRGLAQRLQGDFPGAQRYFQLASEQVPDAFWPRLQLARGQAEMGELAAARTQLEQLLAEADRNGDPFERLAVRNALAVLLWRKGDNVKAEPLLAEALALARETHDADAEATVLSRLGILHTYTDQYDQARRYLQEAMAAERRAGLMTVSPELSHSQGQLALREGDLANASAHIEAALAGFRLQGNRRSEGIALNSLANLRRRQGRFEEARDLAAQTVQLHRELGNPTAEASALIQLAVAQAQMGQLSLAWDTAFEAVQLAAKIDQSPNLAGATSVLGQFSVDLGRHEEAERYLRQAEILMLAADDPVGAWRPRLWLARSAAMQGRREEAEAALEALLAEIGDEGSAAMRVDVLRNLAQLRLDAGDPAGAHARLDQAMAVATQIDDPRRVAQLHAWRANAWLAQDRTDDARRELDLSAGELDGDPLQLRIEAAWLAATGDPAGALAMEQRARDASGERWQPDDQARLAAREAAVR